MFEYSDIHIKQLLDGIYNGSITEYDLPESLYYAIADYLKKAVYKGWGASLSELEKNTPAYETLADLRENVYMFSAAKTYQQVKDITSLMTDDEGKLRTVKEFNELGSERFDLWNDTWGEAEYNTALGQSQSAQKWQEIEDRKDVLPNLVYHTVGDACDICAPLDGITAPVDDPIWDEIAPLNHFNCYCVLEQVDDEANLSNDDDKQSAYDAATDNMDDDFKMNSGKDGVVFKEDHPYFDVPKSDRDYAENNFDLPIPEDDLPIPEDD